MEGCFRPASMSPLKWKCWSQLLTQLDVDGVNKFFLRGGERTSWIQIYSWGWTSRIQVYPWRQQQ